jgi:hypothetical protein
MSAKNIFAAILAVLVMGLDAARPVIEAQIPVLFASGAVEQIVAAAVLFVVARVLGIVVQRYGPQ